MKLDEMTVDALKLLGYEQFVRLHAAQQDAAEATRAINAIQAAIEARSRLEIVPPPREPQ
jgi:hypothetical protein